MGIIAFRRVKDAYGWLGNMSPYPITYMGNAWRTSEALFQALRTDDYAVRERAAGAIVAACRRRAAMVPAALLAGKAS